MTALIRPIRESCEAAHAGLKHSWHQ